MYYARPVYGQLELGSMCFGLCFSFYFYDCVYMHTRTTTTTTTTTIIIINACPYILREWNAGVFCSCLLFMLRGFDWLTSHQCWNLLRNHYRHCRFQPSRVWRIPAYIYTIAIEPPLGCHATTTRVRSFSGLIWAT